MFEFDFMFEFEFDFMLEFEVDMFVFDIGVGSGVDGRVAIGVGLARFVFILLAFELLDVASPQAIPSAASDNMVVSAIFFIEL